MHTTHFDDCGCKSTEYEAKIAHLQERLDEAEKVVDWAAGLATSGMTAHCGICRARAAEYRERYPKDTTPVDDGREIQG